MRTVNASLVLVVAACGGSPSPPAADPVGNDVSMASPGAPGAVIAADPEPGGPCTLPSLASSLPARLDDERQRAVKLLDEGRNAQAKRLLEKVLQASPGNLATLALHDGASRALTERQAAAAEAVETLPRAMVPIPAQGYSLLDPVRATLGPAPRLGGMRMTPNKVVDDEAWFTKNGLTMPVMALNRQKLPQEIPSQIAGLRLTEVIDHGDHRILTHGHRIVTVVAADGRVVRVLDLVSLMNMGGPAQHVRWAQAREGVLYVSNNHMGYARVSGGHNAYVTAIDLASGKIRWRSKPLVANARNFILHGGYVISGYGFTAESDYLYVLARDTGKVVKQLRLATKPDVILPKGDRLFVRGYDKDFVFDLPPDASPPPGPVAGRAPRTEVVLSAEALAARLEPTTEDRCRIRSAILHLDNAGLEPAGASPSHIDEAKSALWKLSRGYKAVPAVAALRDAVNEAQTGERWILQGAVVTPPAPPSKHQLGRPHPRLPAASAPRLVQRSVAKNGITDRRQWMLKHLGKHPARPASAADAQSRFGSRAFPGQPMVQAPPRFGEAKLSRALDHGDHQTLIYDGRFVAVVRQGRPAGLLDLKHFVAPAKVRSEEWARFASQEVTWAQVADGVLYVCNGGGSYAKEVYGLKGFVSALDPKTGALIWRSDPLACNANFVIRGRHLITGYGFTAEPDRLVILDRETGAVASKLPLASAPEFLVLDGNTLHVRTYDTDYVFDVR